MDFALHLATSDMPRTESLYDTCTDVRKHLQNRYPYQIRGCPKKIHFGDLDAFYFDDLTGYFKQLHEAYRHGLIVPVAYGQVRNLVYYCLGNVRGVDVNPLYKASRTILHIANANHHPGFLHTLHLFFPGVKNILLVIDEKKVAHAEGLGGFTSGPWSRDAITLRQHELLDAEHVKRRIESVFSQENSYRVSKGRKPFFAPAVVILARNWRLQSNPVAVEEDVESEYDDEGYDGDKE